MKQTAVEWLAEQVNSKNFTYYGDFFKLVEQAKEIEKQQGYSEEDLKTAFLDGWQLRDGDLPFSKAKKKWFNEFKKEIRL